MDKNKEAYHVLKGQELVKLRIKDVFAKEIAELYTKQAETPKTAENSHVNPVFAGILNNFKKGVI